MPMIKAEVTIQPIVIVHHCIISLWSHLCSRYPTLKHRLKYLNMHTPPRNLGGAIFFFIAVCLCVCVSVFVTHNTDSAPPRPPVALGLPFRPIFFGSFFSTGLAPHTLSTNPDGVGALLTFSLLGGQATVCSQK